MSRKTIPVFRMFGTRTRVFVWGKPENRIRNLSWYDQWAGFRDRVINEGVGRYRARCHASLETESNGPFLCARWKRNRCPGSSTHIEARRGWSWAGPVSVQSELESRRRSGVEWSPVLLEERPCRSVEYISGPMERAERVGLAWGPCFGFGGQR
jgi:hypothetical protein